MHDENAIAQIESDPEVLRVAEIVEAALSGAGEPMSLHWGGPTLRTVWISLRAEVYDLLCTTSKKYKAERDAFTVSVKPALVALGTYLTSQYGVPAAAAGALSGLALLLPLKMAKNAWCVCAQNSTIEAEELIQLKVISGHKTLPEATGKGHADPI